MDNPIFVLMICGALLCLAYSVPSEFREITNEEYVFLNKTLENNPKNEKLQLLVQQDMDDHKITNYEYRQILKLVDDQEKDELKQKLEHK